MAAHTSQSAVSQSLPLIGPVQNIGVEIVSVQVEQRAVERLNHLGGESSRGIVRSAMVLTVRRRKFGLKKQAVARNSLLSKGQ